MDQVPSRLAGWWRGLDAPARRRVTALSLIALVYVAHYLIFCILQPFYIEDAGISFAYSRNLIEGDGLVPYPGGERVEGYSNALWTFLVAGLYGLGVPVWTGSKILGGVFGAATLPIVYQLMRRARPATPDTPEPALDVALLAPLWLAANPQFVIWNASGLENSLYCLLLAGGLLRLLVESDTDHRLFPWSALIFVGVSATRPEGIAYGAVAFAGLLLFCVACRRVLPLLTWLVVFAVPFTAYNYWRYEYFAWPYPNTYYAKVLDNSFQPFSWTTKGWRYIKNYFWTYGLVGGLPLLVLGLFGFRRFSLRGAWRTRLAIGVMVAMAIVIAWDGRAGFPRVPAWWHPVLSKWNQIRTYTLLGAAVLGGLVTLTRPGWRARGLLWATSATSLFFALWSGGDWMKAFRWFNPINLTLFPLILIGLGEILDAFPRLERPLAFPKQGALAGLLTPRRLLLALPTLALAGVFGWYTNAFANDPETAVRDVRRRVDYMTWVQSRLDLDFVTLLDVDMGAHLYYSGWQIADIAGLIDLPIAHHRDYNKLFMAEYLFGERNMEFAHVHGSWANQSKIPKLDDWPKKYIEIPGFPTGGRTLHVGNHVRRDIFIDSLSVVPEPVARFASGVGLVSWELPAPTVAQGGVVYIHTAWQTETREDGFRILVVLDGAEGRTVTTIPPGYDWYRPEEWKAREVVHTRQGVPIPVDLPEGDYTVSLVLLDEKSGAILPFVPPAPTDPVDPAVPAPAPAPSQPEATPYLPGGWRVPVTVSVVPTDEAGEAANALLEQSHKAAAEGRCEESWTLWKNATRTVAKNLAWKQAEQPGVRAAIAGCYVAKADAAQTDDDKAAALIAGRRYDFRHAPLVERAKPLAAQYDARGDEAAAADNWEDAFQAFLRAVQLDPSRSWSRRKAEDARDRRLKIGAYKPDPPAKGKLPTKLPKAVDKAKDAPKEEPKEGPKDVKPEADEEAGGEGLGGGP